MQETTGRPAGAKMRIGDLLVEAGMLSTHRLEQALAEHEASGRRLGEVLMTRGWVSPIALYDVLATQMGLDTADLDDEPPPAVYAKLIPESLARRLGALPTGEHGHQLVVAMVDPMDLRAIDDLKTVTGRSVRPVLASPDQMERAIRTAWSGGERSEVARPDPAPDPSSSIEQATYDALVMTERMATPSDDRSVVEFVRQLLRTAIARGASDVHLEPDAEGMRVRLRIDGTLRDARRPPAGMRDAIVSRIKIMAEIDIAQRRTPQDGRLTVSAGGREVGMRVVTVPTVDGEACVLRVLDSGGGTAPALTELDLAPEPLAALGAAIRSPSGGVLVTGPTGSGKTTTLYSVLEALNSPERAVVTIEDPVEYRLEGVKQIQINVKAGLGFATALRAFMRADPDIVLIGEIRDRETAILAAEASITGHLVLSTLHTNSAASTPTRLIEMGLEPFMVNAGFDCFVAQRLCRRLCAACAEPIEHPPGVLAEAGWPGEGADHRWPGADGAEVRWMAAVGCEACHDVGYSGRIGVHEVLTVDDEISQLIAERARVRDIHRAAERNGMASLRLDALRKAARGLTSVEEVLRVTAT